MPLDTGVDFAQICSSLRAVGIGVEEDKDHKVFGEKHPEC